MDLYCRLSSVEQLYTEAARLKILRDSIPERRGAKDCSAVYIETISNLTAVFNSSEDRRNGIFESPYIAFQIVKIEIAKMRAVSFLWSIEKSIDYPYEGASIGTMKASSVNTLIRESTERLLPPGSFLSDDKFETLETVFRSISSHFLNYGEENASNTYGRLSRYWSYAYFLDSQF